MGESHFMNHRGINKRPHFRLWATLAWLLLTAPSVLAQDSVAPKVELKKISADTLPNALQINERLISGGQPDGEAAFATLRDMGVKTIITVDGAKPDLAAAEKYGLRYVHLPHGYDGITPERAAELAKAVRDLPGPIYLHCHHGKHRSPAAAATACRALGWVTEKEAAEVLQLAGTSPHYPGLFAAARETGPLSPAVLDQLHIDFQPSVPLPEVAEAMVAMERHFDRLEQLAANQWQPLDRHPDLKPAHEALLLREQFTELLRTESVQAEPAAYREQLREGEQLARQLEEQLRSQTTGQADARTTELLRAVKTNCNQCHRQYRDQPSERRINVPKS